MPDLLFQPVPTARFTGPDLHRHLTEPRLFRGLAADWPAVRHWDFAHLARLAPDLPVRLVVGNRESHGTRFLDATLSTYLASLHTEIPPTGQRPYLKEFDLLAAIPQLKHDLRQGAIFPRGCVRSLQGWIGPEGVGTGLHCDYLDNLAVQIVGKKRFYLLHPDTVVGLGAVARKYDPWARLSTSCAQEIARRHGKPGDCFIVDLIPGDVLHIPTGWWHEVSNVTPSILLGGFYGAPSHVWARWAWVRSRDLLHHFGLLGIEGCTCHRDPGADSIG